MLRSCPKEVHLFVGLDVDFSKGANAIGWEHGLERDEIGLLITIGTLHSTEPLCIAARPH